MDHILNTLQSIAIFAFVISLIVFIHELGHYSVARLFGVRVQEFSIGFGKAIYSRVSHSGTQWKIGWLPLGGYVRMLGDAGPASFPDSTEIAQLNAEEKKEAFYLKPLWQKALIVFAGPAANYILAITIISITLMLYGQVLLSNEVGEVVPDSPAQHAGIMAGDVIYQIEDRPVSNLNDLRMALAGNLGEEISLGIKRNDQEYTVHLTPQLKELDDEIGTKIKIPIIGITVQKYTVVQHSPVSAVGLAIKQSYEISALILKSIPQFFTGKRGTEELGGPLTIADYSNKSFTSGGIVGLFMFIAMLSLNLGLINLFPIPMLDGGHLLFYALEALRGRPLATVVIEYSSRIGLVLLLMLMCFAIGNDLMKYLWH